MENERRSLSRIFLSGTAFVALATACSNAPQVAAEPPIRSTTPTSTVVTLSPSAPAGPRSSPRVQPIGWHASVSIIDAKTRARMKYSWHRGCPVPLRDLRLVTMTYWGFDRSVHMGEMVLNKSVVSDALTVFHKMFGARFPIRRMRLVDAYRGNDDRSMAADNTSAFNCRRVTGGSAWSEHAFGWAIDIDPVENPYVSAPGKVLPAKGAKYADRSRRDRGMIHRGDMVYRAFRSIGWRWGGDWRSFHDYQHFSATGR